MGEPVRDGALVRIERIDQGTHHEHWRGRGDSRLRLSWSDRGGVRIHIEGHGDGGFAGVIAERFDAILARHRAVLMLYDLWSMPTYDSQLRVELTAWCRAHLDAITKLHVVQRSKLVAMGVAVANVALGGIIESHASRASFDAALRAARLD